MSQICLMDETGKADPPAVVTQHLDPPRKFVLINSQVRVDTGDVCHFFKQCFVGTVIGTKSDFFYNRVKLYIFIF